MKKLLLILVCVSASFAASYEQNQVDKIKNYDINWQSLAEADTDLQELITMVSNDGQGASAESLNEP